MSERGIDKVVGIPGQDWGNRTLNHHLEEIPDEIDGTTGASPGTAQACDDLGLNSLAANLERFGIKPPGQA